MKGKSVALLELDYSIISIIPLFKSPWESDVQTPGEILVLLGRSQHFSRKFSKFYEFSRTFSKFYGFFYENFLIFPVDYDKITLQKVLIFFKIKKYIFPYVL